MEKYDYSAYSKPRSQSQYDYSAYSKAPEKNIGELPKMNGSALNDVANSPIVNTILGAGDALQGTLSNIGEAMIPGAQLPHSVSSQGTAYDVGTGIGKAAPALAAAPFGFLPMVATGAIQGAVDTKPGEENLGGLLPSGPLGGSLKEALFSTLAAGGLKAGYGALKAGYGALKNPGKIIDYFSPGKAATNTLKELGQGLSNQEETAASLAKDIRESHNVKEEQAKQFFEYPKQIAGKEKIYEKPNPLITTEADKHKELLNKVEDLGIGDLYSKFKESPTFNNAHNLQSELGVMIGDLKKTPAKTIKEGLELTKLHDIRELLKSDMMSFLKKRDLNNNETLAPRYQKGIDLYRENVAPYLSSKKLRDIVRGGKELVDDVHSIFKSPSNIINRTTGETEIGPINKILEDLPESAKNKILFSRIGGNQHIDNPDKFLAAINSAENKGYSKYVSPDLKSKIEDILSKQTHQKYLKAAPKFGGGALGTLLGEELIRRNL